MRKDVIYNKLVQGFGRKELKLISYKDEDGHILEVFQQEHAGKSSCRKINTLIEIIKKR